MVKDYADTFQYDEIYESRIVLQLSAEGFFKNHSTSEQGFEELMRLKNGKIADRLGFHDKKAPENANRRFVLPQSNSLLSFQTISQLNSEYGLLHQRFPWNLFAYLLYQWKVIPETSVENNSKISHRTQFSS